MEELRKEEGGDVNVKDDSGNCGLFKAASKGHMPIVEFLLSEGADINAINEDKETALFEASEKGHFDVCQYLVSKGCDVTITSKWTIQRPKTSSSCQAAGSRASTRGTTLSGRSRARLTEKTQNATKV